MIKNRKWNVGDRDTDREAAEKIAAALGISVKGVEYHITKALKKLREDLRDYYCFLVFFI